MKKSLFDKVSIGKLKLKNRLVMTPMCTNYGTEDGYVTQRLIDYCVARAKGGAGLLQIETAIVDYPEGRCLKYHLSGDEDKYIDGFRQLVEAVHEAAPDCKITVQLHDAGGQSDPSISGCQTRSASSISTHEIYKTPPREMTTEEVKKNVRDWADTAIRMQKAGFDALNIHFGHGYLVGNFLSPLTNHRTDEYGGSWENRSRLAREIMVAVREAVGPDMPLIVRINAWDMIDGGQSFEEGKDLARMCVELGADVIDVSGGVRGSDNPDADCTMAGEDMVWIKYAAEIKKLVAPIPVICVRKITTPENGQKILDITDIDLIGYGRPWIADPDFGIKAQQGRSDEIIPCIACNQGCFEYLWAQKPITCMLNPATGREREFEIKQAEIKKRVMVIGGGPAGMEAARVLKLQGHNVSLFEKDETLGGQLKMAYSAYYRKGFRTMVDYFESTLKRVGVKIYIGTTVTPSMVEAEKPDAIVVATGAKFNTPQIPGGGVSMEDAYKNKAIIGQNVFIRCVGSCCNQGTFYGCDLAETYAKEGKSVTIVTPQETLIRNMGVYRRRHENRRIKELDVKSITRATIKEYKDGYATVTSKNGEEKYACDTVVLGTIPKADHSLYEGLAGLAPEVYEVGDGKQVGNALLAVYEASKLARTI